MSEVLTDGLFEANAVIVGVILGLVVAATVTYLVLRVLRQRAKRSR